MILESSDIESRMNSPMNLMNQLNKLTSRVNNPMNLFIPSTNQVNEISASTNLSRIQDVIHPVDPDQPSIDDLVEDPDKKLQLGIVKTKAHDVMNLALDTLKLNITNVTKAKDLSAIAKDMNAIVTEDNDKKVNQNTQVIVYRPVTAEINQYPVITVHE